MSETYFKVLYTRTLYHQTCIKVLAASTSLSRQKGCNRNSHTSHQDTLSTMPSDQYYVYNSSQPLTEHEQKIKQR